MNMTIHLLQIDHASLKANSALKRLKQVKQFNNGTNDIGIARAAYYKSVAVLEDLIDELRNRAVFQSIAEIEADERIERINHSG